MYEEFLRDPAAVGPEWRRLFESGVVGERPSANGHGGPAPHPAHEATAAAEGDRPSPSVPSASLPSASVPAASVPSGAVPVKGPAAKLVANMEQSLTIPTATTF